MLRTFSITIRFCILVGISLLLIGILVFSMMHLAASTTKLCSDTIGEMFFEGQKQRIQDLSSTMAKSIGEQIKNVKDLDQRNAIIRAAIKEARYEQDKSGYFFVYDGGIVIAHVFPDLVGKDLGGSTDRNGVKFNAELARKAAAGGGFVTFVFNKPGGGTQSKIAYGSQVPGTTLWVGAGVYIDNVEQVRDSMNASLNTAVDGNLKPILIGIAVCVFLFYLPLVVFITRSIIGPVKEASEVAQHISEGNLDVQVQVRGKDEIAKLEHCMATMLTNIRSALKVSEEKTREAEQSSLRAAEAARNAERLSEEAKHAHRNGMLAAAARLETVVDAISTASSDLAGRIEHSERGAATQSQRTSEAATAVEEMNSTVLEVAKNAGAAAETSSRAKVRAQEGAHVVYEAETAISKVQENSLALKADMTTLSQHAQNISQIMSVISDIADQTNLLALNAAIEAARAGEAGRGFAVVADEVRKLAEKTMISTNDVGNAIRAIQQSVDSSIHQVDVTVQTVENATVLSRQSGEALREIVSMVDTTADQVRGIATAAEEQSATTEEIARTVTQVNTLADESLTIMRNAASAVSTLTSQSHTLSDLVQDLKNT